MAVIVKPGPVYRKPLEADWPNDDLEYLGKCPVCGGLNRTMAYTGLQDKVFFCAPGTWTSWRCGACDVVYLDPRPTTSSIGRAYETYYTHDAGDNAAPKEPGFFKKLRRIVPNSYLNKKFGYKLRPSLPFAALALECQPNRAVSTAHYYRHLPAPKSTDDVLLDVGCGNGAFLQIARDDLKYRVEGLEIDPRARKAALLRGLTVHEGSMPGSGLRPESYYQITLSHVLEHLHDPKSALRECFALLKPGGRVWIAVPNIAAASLAHFGANSRLLEPPRHLVMFDTKSLLSILKELLFENTAIIPTFENDFVLNQSLMIERGVDPYATDFSVICDKLDEVKHSDRYLASSNFENADIIIAVGTKPT